MDKLYSQNIKAKLNLIISFTGRQSNSIDNEICLCFVRQYPHLHWLIYTYIQCTIYIYYIETLKCLVDSMYQLMPPSTQTAIQWIDVYRNNIYSIIHCSYERHNVLYMNNEARVHNIHIHAYTATHTQIVSYFNKKTKNTAKYYENDHICVVSLHDSIMQSGKLDNKLSDN